MSEKTSSKTTNQTIVLPNSQTKQAITSGPKALIVKQTTTNKPAKSSNTVSGITLRTGSQKETNGLAVGKQII